MSVVAGKSYVEYRTDSYWIQGTRISLDSVVYAFREGLSPESIAQAFPLLNLEQIYGAIAFYLANRPEIDTYLVAEEAAFEAMPQPSVQDKKLYKDARKGFHENYQIRYMKPYEPGYTITKCTATPLVMARS